MFEHELICILTVNTLLVHNPDIRCKKQTSIHVSATFLTSSSFICPHTVCRSVSCLFISLYSLVLVSIVCV